MACCEKCWNDAFHRYTLNQSKSQAEYYQDLIKERNNNPCTQEEQAGDYWDNKNQCDTRIG